MNAIAVELQRSGIFETTGMVVSAGNGLFQVQKGTDSFRVQRAFSCLVEPEVGDRVLLAGDAAAGLYILAVLERQTDATRLKLEGDLSIELADGRFTVAATEGVNLVSRKTVTVAANELEVQARRGHFFIDRIRLLGTTLEANLERLSQTVKHLYRRVLGVDHLRAGQIDYASEGSVRLHGENTLMTARELVKADAKQIHLG
jgi:hypothetical protein